MNKIDEKESNTALNHSRDSNEPREIPFDTDLSSNARSGLLLFILLFGFGGIWATTAPINGAALASGEVTVRSYSKTVQHLEGGIIKDLLVENGERVRPAILYLNWTTLNPLLS